MEFVEEHTDMMPVLEMEMTGQNLKIRLADEYASLEVTLPKAFMDHLWAKWQEYQNGTAPGTITFSRHYTGAWKE